MRHAGLPSDETRSISTTHAMEAGSNYLTPPWFRVTAQSSTAFKVALADNDVVADTETAGTSPRSVSYKDLSAADSAVSWAPPLPPPPAGAIDAASFSSLSPPTLRLLPSLVPAGWALLIAIWAGLAVAIRAEASDAPPFLAIAFSGWTAVVATALGGLPLLLTRPERVPTKMIVVANAAAAGMMVGAGLGMFGGLVEELPATGSLAPAAGIAAGAVIVATVGKLGATAGSSNRVAMVVVAFAADAFADGLRSPDRPQLARGPCGRGATRLPGRQPHHPCRGVLARQPDLATSAVGGARLLLAAAGRDAPPRPVPAHRHECRCGAVGGHRGSLRRVCSELGQPGRAGGRGTDHSPDAGAPRAYGLVLGFVP